MTATTNHTRPLNFGVHSDGRPPCSYGEYSWAIGLPDGREVFLEVDTVDALPNGALVCSGGFRRDDAPEDEPRREARPTLILPPGAWVHAYASSALDGTPVSVRYLRSPED